MLGPRTSRRGVVAALVLAAATAAGCGGSDGDATTTTARATTPASADLASMLVADGALPGYRHADPVTSSADATTWARRLHDDASRLRAGGFRRGSVVDLANPHGVSGVSLVEEFGDAAKARTEVQYLVRGGSPVPPSTFPVPGLPGAVGFGDRMGRNVVFTKGALLFVLGTRTGKGAASERQLARAARAQDAAAR